MIQISNWFLARGKRQVMFAPLVPGEDVIGFLSIPIDRSGAYKVEHADLAQALAHQTPSTYRFGGTSDDERHCASNDPGLHE